MLLLRQNFLKGWLGTAKLKPTLTLLGRDFVISNTFTWQNLYQGQNFALELALLFCPCVQGKKEGKIYEEINQRAKKRAKP